MSSYNTQCTVLGFLLYPLWLALEIQIWVLYLCVVYTCLNVLEPGVAILSLNLFPPV